MRNDCRGVAATMWWRGLPGPRERAQPLQDLSQPPLSDRPPGYSSNFSCFVVADCRHMSSCAPPAPQPDAALPAR
eukprot:9391625-Alexandrium_andersonii.AAC.1